MYEEAHLTFRNFTAFYLLELVLLFPLPPDFYSNVLFFMLQSILLITFK